ncbi:hypothetical protein [Sphingosinicella sp. BN140058]|uniref:hypothetical protein n=1 Tax=Sphingosinicella sp. BN140058 TaxID=1892855 RepID=UPI001013C0AC|nr:hypothetical protein [Sphingosinicella sp. BN140058]QAY80357.1 hypothetical protein ETR14_27330 [Sphingosinicella sp. BN140058]
MTPGALVDPAFHWTDMGDFDQFEMTNDIGFHFGTRATALRRAEQVRGGEPASQDERLIVAQLRLEAPLSLPDLLCWEPKAIINALEDVGVISQLDAEEAFQEALIDRHWVQEVLAKKGFDSIVYENHTEGGGKSWIALDPEQITIRARERVAAAS